MERAGLRVAEKIAGLFVKKKVVVLAGGGNNGGDGLVAARELFNRGWHVKVLLLSKEGKLSPDCLAQYRILKKTGVPLEFRSRVDKRDFHGAVLVDAVLGTGLNKPVGPPLSDIIRLVNKTDIRVISVDIPSGISSDDGRIMGDAVRADVTVTFGLPKIGHLIHPGAEYTGRLFIEDIGFPAELLNSDTLRVQSIEEDDIFSLLPARPAYSHKGDYGHVLLIAGSRGKTGAALMAAKACLRTGAGMVTIGVPETLADIFQSRVTEEMVLPLPDDGSGMLSIRAIDDIASFISSKADVIAAGPGIGVTGNTRELMDRLIRIATVPILIDADGINSLQSNAAALKKAKAPVILTPHAGEMARLLDISSRVPEHERIPLARSFSRKNGSYLVLKGAPALVAGPEGQLLINTTGNPGMAKAGAGDVLTGMIAAFLGQGLNPLDASVAGVYMHGLSGDRAAEKKGMHSLIASDIIEMIPDAFLSLKKRNEYPPS
jgi:NAD(P)H-hydrate epimerase